MHVAELETPAVIVDLDIMDANIHEMQAFLDSHGVRCRPHTKTHKIPAIAHRQIAAGAVGVTCQKLSEAEVMVNAGIGDILLPYNVVGDAKLTRLVRMVRQATLRVTVDSGVTLQGISERMQQEGLTVEVLVECDLGAKRCGVQSVDEAVALAVEIKRLPGVAFGGLMTFKGGEPDIDHIERSSIFFEQVVEKLRASSIEVPSITAGGTVYARNAWPQRPPFGVNETRPGVYVFNDRVKVSQGVATLDDCAMRVICTVVSRPTADRAIIDGGSKTFTMNGPPWVEGYGYFTEFPGASMPRMSEEHGVVNLGASSKSPRIGDRLEVIPNYVNSLVAMHDLVFGVRKGTVEAVWPVAARYCIH